ncbi:hypothetical protein [Streptomyces sp. NPDC059010]|uniref:hypothetical protein n=1 Tax=Streptomyces sp. NPDC059010 TaxID=3346695 RepID=UPI0036933050
MTTPYPPSPQQPPYPPMTPTTTHTTPTTPVADFPLPPPPGRPRGRRGIVVAVVTVVVLLLAGGGFAVWRLVYGDDGGPLAGRPRVSDSASGISYAIPEGWKQGKGKLIGAFTSTIAQKQADNEGADDSSGSTVLAGRGEGVAEGQLGAYTERWARSNAEFFLPYRRMSKGESRALTVDGRPAHTVVVNVADSDTGPGRLRMTVVSVDDSRVAFLIGITTGSDGNAEQNTGPETVDAVLRSMSVGVG